jgi:uncharacterized protein YecE (DUF72 family)
MIRTGPAGWSYRDWEGIVYPRPRPAGFDPLAYLAGYFDTIEINSTFYRPASTDSAASWAMRTSANPDFRFSAKLWRRFTHERDEAFTRADVAAARAALDPLQDAGRLGVVLLQFPWSFRRDDASRQWLDDVTSTFRDFRLAVEVRHESWNVPRFFEELTDRNVSFVNIDQPRFKHSIGPTARATSPIGYVRIHGRNYAAWFRKGARVEERYDYLYTAEELAPWVDRITELADTTDDTYVVTNNHYKGKGIANALMIRSMIAGDPVPAPPALVEAYPDVLAGFVDAPEPALNGSSPRSAGRRAGGGLRGAAPGGRSRRRGSGRGSRGADRRPA